MEHIGPHGNNADPPFKPSRRIGTCRDDRDRFQHHLSAWIERSLLREPGGSYSKSTKLGFWNHRGRTEVESISEKRSRNQISGNLRRSPRSVGSPSLKPWSLVVAVVACRLFVPSAGSNVWTSSRSSLLSLKAARRLCRSCGQAFNRSVPQSYPRESERGKHGKL